MHFLQSHHCFQNVCELQDHSHWLPVCSLSPGLKPAVIRQYFGRVQWDEYLMHVYDRSNWSVDSMNKFRISPIKLYLSIKNVLFLWKYLHMCVNNSSAYYGFRQPHWFFTNALFTVRCDGWHFQLHLSWNELEFSSKSWNSRHISSILGAPNKVGVCLWPRAAIDHYAIME